MDAQEQMSLNLRWLLGRVDAAHGSLCPGSIGTWQGRAEQLVVAAGKAAARLEAADAIAGLLDRYLALGSIDGRPERRQLRAELARAVERYYGRTTDGTAHAGA